MFSDNEGKAFGGHLGGGVAGVGRERVQLRQGAVPGGALLDLPAFVIEAGGLQRREVAVIEADGEQSAGLLGRLHHPPAALDRGGHRLFDEHVRAGGERRVRAELRRA